MKNYSQYYNTKKTPQSQPIPGSVQVPNSAGGFVFPIDDWKRLHRFLIMGSEGGTYYIDERKLTIENADAVLRCIKENGFRVVDEVFDISVQGRAPKNDPALFVLAMCAGLGNEDTKAYALKVLPEVARIGTHLFNFAEYVQAFRGWGRALRRAIGAWYTEKDADKLAYQLVKYQQRDGWSHRDLLRLAHPKPPTDKHGSLFNWATQGDEIPAGTLVDAFEQAKTADENRTISLINAYGLTREMIQTKHLNSPAVWEALLEKMPMTAMIRNLGKMTQVGLIGPLSEASKLVIDRLNDAEYIQRSRIHPLNVLVALKTYDMGHGFRGGLSWSTDQNIVDALNETFYKAFDNVPATNKRYVLGVDVSGSMMRAAISGLPITAAEAAGAMAMVTRRTESQVVLRGFSDGGHGYYSARNAVDPRLVLDGFKDLHIGRNDRLDNVIRKINDMGYGGTDCAIPMMWAIEHEIEADVFVIYTDNETWAGLIHPAQALKEYRRVSGITAKLIVMGMAANGFSIADPNDAGMLDVVGFDTSVPSVIEGFILEG